MLKTETKPASTGLMATPHAFASLLASRRNMRNEMASEDCSSEHEVYDANVSNQYRAVLVSRLYEAAGNESETEQNSQCENNMDEVGQDEPGQDEPGRDEPGHWMTDFTAPLPEADWEKRLLGLIPSYKADLYHPISASILERNPAQLALWLAEIVCGMSEEAMRQFASRLDEVFASVSNGLYSMTVGDILCIGSKGTQNYMVNPRGKASPLVPSFLAGQERSRKANRWFFGN